MKNTKKPFKFVYFILLTRAVKLYYNKDDDKLIHKKEGENGRIYMFGGKCNRFLFLKRVL